MPEQSACMIVSYVMLEIFLNLNHRYNAHITVDPLCGPNTTTPVVLVHTHLHLLME